MICKSLDTVQFLIVVMYVCVCVLNGVLFEVKTSLATLCTFSLWVKSFKLESGHVT